MKITLYKKCRLTSKYTDVLHFNYQEDYLETLDSVSFIYDEVYIKDNNYLIFELNPPFNTNSIYEYNYIKLENTINGNVLTRYAFINEIVIGNNIATIYYETDIWATYSKSLIIKQCYLTNSLNLKIASVNGDIITTRKIPFYFLPLEYHTNEQIVLENAYPTPTTDRRYMLFALAQIYKLSSGENVTQTDRICTSVYITDGSGTIASTFSNCIKMAIGAVNQQGRKFNSNIELYKESYVEFSNFTIIPIEFFGNLIDVQSMFTQYSNKFGTFSYNSGDTVSQTATFYDLLQFTYNGVIQSIDYDSTIKSIGTLSTEFKLDNNGTDTNIQMILYVNKIDLKLILSFNGKYIDITDEFVIDIPFTGINGEVSMQRQIAKELKVINGATNIINGGIQIAENAYGIANPINSKQLSFQEVSKIGNTTYTSRYSERIKGNNGDIDGIVSGANKVVGGIIDIVYANKEKYQNQYGAFLKGNKVFNIRHGILIKKIIPDNLEEVNNLIKQIGYQVFEALDEYNLYVMEFSNYGYEVLKFDSLCCYGSFPTIINNSLSNILQNGVRIWNDVNKFGGV